MVKLANGCYDGIVGALQSNQADLGIGYLSHTLDRSVVIDLSYPHIIDVITFTSPTPTLIHFISLFKPGHWIHTIEHLATAQESHYLQTLSSPLQSYISLLKSKESLIKYNKVWTDTTLDSEALLCILKSRYIIRESDDIYNRLD
ncbi:unnamed protein product [Medioppia subpectinata]|uniref:Uncharacterized protein n=1 Tax=Medioppia subpectinata TaxID=1979941 RepID=A0A7R9KNW0_9ACAR|nr:unnamed protein product [Medioppia subpectinata]CAG2105894.1 unnamed protein product [Medioppia subpectinata]